MDIFEKIKEISLEVVTFGKLGYIKFGDIIASAFAIPFLFLFKGLYEINESIFYWSISLGLILSIIIIQIAIQKKPVEKSEDEESEPEVIDTECGEAKIVLDKIIGVMAAFIYVPLKLRVVIFGFVLFHIINTFQVFAFYKRIIKYAENLPGALGIIGSDILSGLLVNLFLQLIYWVMR